MNLGSHTRITLAALGALVALGGAGTANAQTPASQEGLALARQKNCMSCHAENRALLGPAMRDIGAKYASRPDAQSYLARKIVDGSSGVWGQVPMPANTQVSAPQAAALAAWILSLK
ncbi:MAG TPA: c-type cytochrome [Paraburkholderia sp.]|jgi:cytochrome c|nr:c-type cytochrome [Paraburkholderia sp.]